MNIRTMGVGIVVLAAGMAFAETIKWTGANQSGYNLENPAQDWFEPTNWDLGRIPQDGDDVEIKNPVGSTLWYITITNSTPHLNSLTTYHSYPSGNPHYRIYVRVRGWETKVWADTISIGRGSSIQACDSFGNDEPSNRVWIVGKTMTLEAYGEEAKDGHLSAVGYKINNGPGYKCYPEVYTGNLLSAAAHGGMGMGSDGSSTLFQTYGSAEWPLQPGTGGGGTSAGSAGGGAILVELTGDLIVNGWIGADGGDPGSSNRSVGSGGSVCITCRSLTGSGRISAAGNAYSGYGAIYPWAGGGRVAVHYNAEAQTNAMANCRVQVRANGGSYGTGTAEPRYHRGVGGSGTVWFPDRLFLDQQRPYRVAGVLANLSLDEPIVLDDDFDISDGLLAFNEPASVRIAGSSTVSGGYTCLNGFDFEAGNSSLEIGGNLSLSGANVRFRAGGTFDVGGDLSLVSAKNGTVYQGGGLWLVASGGEMGEPTMTVAVGGSLTANPYTMIRPVCDSTTGSIVTFKAKNITLCPNSLTYAFGAGFAVNKGPGAKSGYGGTHGGKGADAKTNSSEPYGKEKLPVTPGSGGAATEGGGVIYMEAEKTLTCNGVVNASADGTTAQTFWHCGAGGSVSLLCNTFAGDAGVITANGGNAGGGGGAAYGGGGGRIAIRRAHDVSDHEKLTVAVAGGRAGTSTVTYDPADDGTIYWGTWRQGFMILLR